MKKFYIDCTDAFANPHNCQEAIPEDKIQSYIDDNYDDERVLKFDHNDVGSDAYYQALRNEGNVVFGEWYDSDRIIKSFASVIKRYEKGQFDEFLQGVSKVKFYDGDYEADAVLYASDLDEEYIKAISEKVGHQVVMGEYGSDLYTKKMFDVWHSWVDSTYNEIFE